MERDSECFGSVKYECMTKKRLIECVPNFSEGRNADAIRRIVDAIASSGEVYVLHVDSGEAANRTVVTFVGEPEMVVEGAFRGVACAAEIIDMRCQHGVHPRIGATDVLPLIPVSGVTLDECVALARGLARRISDELGIPVYCYEAAAFRPERRNLAVCRRGEYEGLKARMATEEGSPDFGGGNYTERVARSGATVVGAREFLIAVNFNLDTDSAQRAHEVALDVREKGRPKREGGLPSGNIIRDRDGKAVMIPGTLKGCKAIGWYIEEYGIAQVSMNITNIGMTPLHVAFEEVCRAAQARGMRVTGTEIIGLVPKCAILEAGRYFLHKRQQPVDVGERRLIEVAAESMGLNDLAPFRPEEKILEYVMEIASGKRGRCDDK